MDHKEQHHEHHRHERDERKKDQHEFEQRQEKSALPFHPAWLVAAGVGLVLAAVLIWTFVLRP
jgi:hypothetical protein